MEAAGPDDLSCRSLLLQRSKAKRGLLLSRGKSPAQCKEVSLMIVSEKKAAAGCVAIVEQTFAHHEASQCLPGYLQLWG